MEGDDGGEGPLLDEFGVHPQEESSSGSDGSERGKDPSSGSDGGGTGGEEVRIRATTETVAAAYRISSTAVAKEDHPRPGHAFFAFCTGRKRGSRISTQDIALGISSLVPWIPTTRSAMRISCVSIRPGGISATSANAGLKARAVKITSGTTGSLAQITRSPHRHMPSLCGGGGQADQRPGEQSNEYNILTLDSIRRSLIKHDETIIFSPLERSQFCYNPGIVGFNGTLVEFMVQGTEKWHSMMGRYKSPDKHPFFPEQLMEPVLLSAQYKNVWHPAAASININKEKSEYFDDPKPRLISKGSDGNYGSRAFSDTIILQVLFKRIHYGKFVADAKFQESPYKYNPAIKAQGKDLLMKILTYVKAEENVKRRVNSKAMTSGQVLHPTAASININIEKSEYFDDLKPRLMSKGSDGNYGSSAFSDTMILQALSKRIHYGKFVAEAKFQESPYKYKLAIRAQGKDELMKILSYVKVEENIKRHVKSSAMTFSQLVESDDTAKANMPLKIEPELTAELYDQGSASAVPPQEAGLSLDPLHVCLNILTSFSSDL